MPQIGEYCPRELRQNHPRAWAGRRIRKSSDARIDGIGRISFQPFGAPKARAIEAVLNKHPHDPSPYIRANSACNFGEAKMAKFLTCVSVAGILVGATSVAEARSLYDGSWDLLFVTQRGTCDSNYSFTVNINDGLVTHPNLVRFKGYVAPSGAVRASVTVQDKYASGSGRLANNSGRGTWRGYSGTARCSGYWTAQRN
jgi:hypothetical protein